MENYLSPCDFKNCPAPTPRLVVCRANHHMMYIAGCRMPRGFGADSLGSYSDYGDCPTCGSMMTNGFKKVPIGDGSFVPIRDLTEKS